MKKTISLIAIFTVLLFSVSAGYDREPKPVQGSQAPWFEVKTTDGSTISLSQMRGRYVLVSFWASNDACSRINTTLYDRFLKADPDGEKLSLLSVNVDRSERLFRETVRRDRMDAESQFHVFGNEASQLMHRYGQNTTDCQSFLIDPQGVVVAVNPDVEALAAVLG